MSDYTDEQLIAYCGINCKECKARSHRRIVLATKFKESLQELPLDLFSQIFPPFKNIQVVMDFLDTFAQFSYQTCCTDAAKPCGDPGCAIRSCVQQNGFRTCAECDRYQSCEKLDFLKPHHPTLISDLDAIHDHGLNYHATEVIGKFKLDRIDIE